MVSSPLWPLILSSPGRRRRCRRRRRAAAELVVAVAAVDGVVAARALDAVVAGLAVRSGRRRWSCAGRPRCRRRSRSLPSPPLMVSALRSRPASSVVAVAAVERRRSPSPPSMVSLPSLAVQGVVARHAVDAVAQLVAGEGVGRGVADDGAGELGDLRGDRAPVAVGGLVLPGGDEQAAQQGGDGRGHLVVRRRRRCELVRHRDAGRVEDPAVDVAVVGREGVVQVTAMKPLASTVTSGSVSATPVCRR